MRLLRDGDWLFSTAMVSAGIAVLLFLNHPRVAAVMALYWMPLSFLRWWWTR